MSRTQTIIDDLWVAKTRIQLESALTAYATDILFALAAVPTAALYECRRRSRTRDSLYTIFILNSDIWEPKGWE